MADVADAICPRVHGASEPTNTPNMADKFKSIAKGGWHPERDRAQSNGGGGGGRLGQVVWSILLGESAHALKDAERNAG